MAGISNGKQERRETRWQTAEKQVASQLTELLVDGYIVANNVPFPYGNLDHLAVSPEGAVFLMETKSHVGHVFWNGARLLVNNRPFETDPIQQINRSIRWVRGAVNRLLGKNPWIVPFLYSRTTKSMSSTRASASM